MKKVTRESFPSTAGKLESIIVLLALLASSGQAAASDALEWCHIEGYRQEVRCGTHSVFEDRSTGSGRQIDIHFVVIPAIQENAEPDPLVLLAGGPGQGAIGLAPLVDSAFETVNERRDVVLIDQRGMGASGPLACESLEESALAAVTPAERRRLDRELLERCLSRLDADVTAYTQDLANADIHEITQALGYRSINLYGGSWGTRSALLYAHQFPDQVRTMVLDGNLPIENIAPSNAPSDGARALRRLFEDCSLDASCQLAFPELEQDFEQALSLLGPDGSMVTIDDPTTHQPQSFLMTQEDFGSSLFGILYSASASRTLPLIIHEASTGDFEPLGAVVSLLEFQLRDVMSRGASLSIFCSEELARLEVNEPGRVSGPGLLGYGVFEAMKNACSVWPAAPLPDIYLDEIESSVPALILSGELDPITPPRWGEAMNRALPHSLHIVASATAHGVAAVGCAPDLIAQFVEGGTPEGIDGRCLQELTRPSFIVDASGPRAAEGQ